MTVLDKLATALGRRDEVPNQELAELIVRTRDRKAVQELVENLSNKNTNIQGDCIKVLYEIGEREPGLIAEHHEALSRLLESSNNRLVWGAMTALDAIAAVEPAAIYRLVDKIVATADAGSVITRDHAVGILINLAKLKPYAKKCLLLLIEQLRSCPANQLPMYAEKALAVATPGNKKLFQKVLSERLSSLPKASQKKRLLKVMDHLERI
jgi:hypothetical protein